MKKIRRLICLVAIAYSFTSSAIAQEFDGYALYNRLNQQTTYLIDKNGDIAHTWSNNVNCNYAVLLKDNGNIVRGGVYNGNQINGAAVGGMIQEINPDGDVVWEFIYSDADHITHHDIALMPNGHVLMIAWERKSSTELQDAGYTGNNSFRYATHIIQVAQNGAGGGIVWEWHIWDHLIQNVDPNKPNYGVVADHPELLNINVQTSGGMGGPGGGGDWFHVNGIHYNEELDQIAFSSRFLSEIFIIDHSTTSAEAASHSGGNSGKGGDFLYRWGNPSNYGAPGAQVIPGAVHDIRWITNDGRPNAGYLQIFNNTGGGGNSSTVDAWNPPLSADGYNYDWTPGQAYAPSTYEWRHECLDYAWGQSAADRLPNGNTFVNMSGEYMYEVDSLDNVVWQYNDGPAKAFRYTCDHPGIRALVEGGYIDNLCNLVSVDEVHAESIVLSPNPSSGIFNIDGLPETTSEIRVYDIFGKSIQNAFNNSEIDLSGQASGIYYVSILLESGQSVTKKVSLLK